MVDGIDIGRIVVAGEQEYRQAHVVGRLPVSDLEVRGIVLVPFDGGSRR